MLMYRLFAVAALLVLSACSSTPSSPRTSSSAPPIGTGPGDTSRATAPGGTAPALPSLPSAAGANSGQGVCGAFTSGEIGQYVGQEASPGEVSGPLNTACTWDTPGNGNVAIQVVPADYYLPRKSAGYRELSGVGTRAFVETSMFGGWLAGAQDEGKAILVDISSAGITADRAVALLTAAVRRLP
jgi:hypothetical protein